MDAVQTWLSPEKFQDFVCDVIQAMTDRIDELDEADAEQDKKATWTSLKGCSHLISVNESDSNSTFGACASTISYF